MSTAPQASDPHQDETLVDLQQPELVTPTGSVPATNPLSITVRVKAENWADDTEEATIDLLLNGSVAGTVTEEFEKNSVSTVEITTNPGAPANSTLLPADGQVDVALKFPSAQQQFARQAGSFTVTPPEEEPEPDPDPDPDPPTDEIFGIDRQTAMIGAGVLAVGATVAAVSQA